MSNNKNNNRRYNNNNNYNKQNKNNNEHKYDTSKRTIDSLLSFNDIIEYDEDVKARQQNQNNQNQNVNRKHNEDDDRFDNKDVSKNILRETVEDHEIYDAAEMIDKLTKQNGLIDMIQDIKNCKKKNMKTPHYIEEIFFDMEFAKALTSVLDEYYDKEDPFGRVLVSKKDMNIILECMYLTIKKMTKYLNRYKKNAKTYKSFQQMGDIVTDIYKRAILKYSKKKMKKLMKECPKLTKEVAQMIMYLTAGGDPAITMYSLLYYMYTEATEFKFTEKIIRAIFKICYSKEDQKGIIKALMLEKRPGGDPIYHTTLSEEMDIVWSKVDKIMREELEKLPTDEIEKMIMEYIKIRKQQERKYRLPRRFGNRKAYHPDDFRKIVTVCEKIEAQDRSLLPYLR